MKEDSFVAGSFVPGVFRIDLESDIEELINMKDDEYVAFAHEYIHYLQNILTPYGLLELLYKLFEIQISLCEAGKTDSDRIKHSDIVTFLENGEYSPEIKNFMEIMPKTLGCLSTDDTYDGYKIIKYKIKDTKDTGTVVVRYEKDETERSFEFGSIHIQEFMAKSISEAFFPDGDECLLTYKIADDLCKYILGDKLKEVSNHEILIWCEYSLYSLRPALFLVRVAEAKRDGKYSSEFLESPAKMSQGIGVDILDVNNIRLQLFESVRKLFGNRGDTDISELTEYYSEIFKRISGLMDMEQHSHFISSLVLQRDNVKFSDYLKKIASYLGCPHIFNKNKKYLGSYFNDERLQEASLLLCVFDFLSNIIQEGTFGSKCRCVFYEDCSDTAHPYHKTFDGDACERILKECLEYISEKGAELCPVAQIIYCYDLHKKTVE